MNKTFLYVLSFLLVLQSSHGLCQAGLNDGLVAYYPFDGNAKESSGQYVDGLLRGNATFKQGVLGQALYLDGAGDYVDIGNGLNLEGNYSVSCWVKSEDLSRKYPAILAKYATNRYGPYDFDLHYNKVSLWISDGHGGYSSTDSNKSLLLDAWTSIVYTVQYNKLSIYIDGILDKTATIPVVTRNGDRVTIGRQALMFSPYSDLEYRGYIDELRVYNRVLSAEDIHAIHNSGSVYATPSDADLGSNNLLEIASKNFTITNSTKTSVSIASASLSGSSANDFSLSDTCTGQTLEPNSTCTITANYQPRSCGAKTASIAVPYGTGTLTIPLTASACAVGNAVLGGWVTDAVTHLPVPGAQVVLGQLPVPTKQANTSADGGYYMTNIVSGSYPLTVTKSGYDRYGATLTLNPLQSQIKDVELQPAASGFRVISVKSKYSNGKPYYFLPGVNFANGLGIPAKLNFTASVDWNGKTPGKVRFITSRGQYDVTTTTDSATISLFVGDEFDPCSTLKAVAIASDGSRTNEIGADFLVTKEMYDPFMTTNYSIVEDENTHEFIYKNATGTKKSFIDHLIDADMMSPNVPFFGKNALKLQYIPDLDFEYNGTKNEGSYTLKWGNLEAGKFLEDEFKKYKKKDHNLRNLMSTYNHYLETGKIDGRRVPKGAVGGFDFGLFPVLSLKSSFLPSTCLTSLDDRAAWDSQGYFGLALDIKFSQTRQFPTMGSIPVPWYIKGVVGITLDASVNITDLIEPEFNGELISTPSLTGTLGAGVNEIAGVEGTVKGSLTDRMEWSPLKNSVKTAIDLDAKMYAYVWEWKTPTQHWEWCLSGCTEANVAAKAVLMDSRPTIISRNYLNSSSAGRMELAPKFTVKSVSSESQPYSIAMSPLITATYPISSSYLSSAGNGVNLLWTGDDPTRSSVNRTMLMHSTFDGSVWSTPTPVADNGSADFNPASLTFNDGTIAAAWEDTKEALADTATLAEMTTKQEISAAIYDSGAKAWGTSLRLTDNTTLDRTPKLAGRDKNNIMLTWIANENGDLSGGAANPNKLWYALYNGTIWSTPQVAASIPNAIKRYTVAYDGSTAHLVLALDTDGDQSTMDDLELYKTTYSSGTWGTLTRLTSDSVIDDNPQLTVDRTNAFVLTSIKGGELSGVVNFDFAKRTVIRSEESYNSTLADYKQAVAGDGKVAVIYADTSEGSSSDLYGVFFDPAFKVWGAPKQLTFDDETEMRPAIAFLGNEKVVAVYNRKLLLNADGTSTTSALTDLYMLTHTMGNDLALEAGSLTGDPITAAPGEKVTLSVNAQNLGDKAGQNILVTFYNSDPAAGGTVIGTAMISDILKPGDARLVSLSWTIPAGTAPVEVFAVIDPAAAIDPLNRANNVTSRKMSLPDPAIRGTIWQSLGATRYVPIITVTNNGGTPSPATTLTVRRDSATGPVLATIPVAPLARFASVDYSFDWDISASKQRNYTVIATIDEENALVEKDKLNNSSQMVIDGPLRTLTATLLGSGSGTVTSDPSGISCTNGSCSALFEAGKPVSLHSTPSMSSLFTTWGGGCMGAADCGFSLNSDATVTATFTTRPALRIVGATTTYYDTLTSAFAGMVDGSTVTLQTRATTLSEGLHLNRNIKLSIEGGFDSGFANSSGKTIIQGELKIQNGSLRVKHLALQ
ncbi:MAG: hypothetical protein A2075_01105 [Geobacteraceae bacterium GWC2_58_44]|nr:MAG: hypothetical protein A2075_01105 [Geobacteraceae bacterium GWC2_58_44]HBG04780.1 hypothetical protein [Geobacter sp.]